MSENITPTIETPVTPEAIPAEVITPNMSLNSTDQAWIQALVEEKIQKNNKEEKIKREFSNFGKKLFKFLLTPAKKLDSENEPINAMSGVASFFCSMTAYVGYLASLAMIATMVMVTIKQPSLVALLTLVGSVAISTVIAIFSKAIELAGIEIEKTNNSTLMLSAVAFWIAFWPIARDFVTFVSDCL